MAAFSWKTLTTLWGPYGWCNNSADSYLTENWSLRTGYCAYVPLLMANTNTSLLLNPFELILCESQIADELFVDCSVCWEQSPCQESAVQASSCMSDRLWHSASDFQKLYTVCLLLGNWLDWIFLVSALCVWCPCVHMGVSRLLVSSS